MTKARTVGAVKREKREKQERAQTTQMPERHPRSPKETGPTKETMAHGDYVTPDGGKGARIVYTNRHASLLGLYLGNGLITKVQCAAGLMFGETHHEAWGSAHRDSTIPPVGGVVHETEAQAERHAHARARLNTILNRVGPRAYSLLRSVCVFGESLGRDRGRNVDAWSAFRSGLDECRIVYGISDA